MEDDDDAGACGPVLEWVHGLPTEEELTPLSHPLIPPALAAAFCVDARVTAAALPPPSSAFFDCSTILALDSPTSHLSFRCDDDDEEEGEGEGEGESEDATSGSVACGGGRAGSGKKARMVWTPELHHRFVEAVAHLGDKRAVPKSIVRLMNVDGLTRENVASHLQKYRIYLKRTRNAARLQPPTPLPPAYGSHFRPRHPCDTNARSDCSAFSTSPATARSPNATKHSRLWDGQSPGDGNGPNKHKTY